MKFSKKVLPMVLAMAMIPTMSMTAFATQSATEVNNSNVNIKNHTFAAYQIFKGDYHNETLSNVIWGTGVNGFKYDGTSDAGEIAKKLAGVNAETANAFAKEAAKHITGTSTIGTGSITIQEAGYYLIVDTTSLVDNTDPKNPKPVYDASNLTLLEVTAANEKITPRVKTDKPSVEKKVAENTKYNQNGGYGDTYNDVADYNMGDSVNFHLIGAVPDMGNYDTYKYEFEDTLSAGLTAPAESDVKVYLSNDKILETTGGTPDTELNADFTVSVSTDEATKNSKINVSFSDLKTVEGIAKGKYIIVDYSAVLNQDAVVGLNGNENKVKLRYSNNPNQSGGGENTPTGETPEDKVIVFTYELDVTKVDGQDANKKLAGAEFKLMNANKTKYAIVENGKVTGWTENEKQGTVLTSDNNGLFTVTGLDDNTYYLKETKAPDGYNTLKDPIEFVIKATTANNQEWGGSASSAFTKLEIGLKNNKGEFEYTDGTTDDGSVSMTVKNNKGSILPETGGIGTTIFYIVGVVLVLGAGVLLVTKKRMNADK